MEDIGNTLGIFVNTYNSGKYSDWDTLRSKFPELDSYDSKVLGAFVNTYNSGKYSEWDTLMSKFPEFGSKPTKSRVSISDISSPKELYNEAPTPYQGQDVNINLEEESDKPTNKWDRTTIDEDRRGKAIRYANKTINDKIQTDRVNYAQKPLSKDRVISAMGELPSDKVSYGSFEKEKIIGFGERESRDRIAKEVFNSMPDFLEIATPEDLEIAKYGEDYVNSRKEEEAILAIKQAKNRREYDEILAADNIILDDNINLAELSTRSALKNLANFMMPTQVSDAQARQEFALQDKQEAAAYERYMINRESAKVGEYLEYAGNALLNKEAQLRGELHQRGLDWDQYNKWKEVLAEGGKLSDEELQQAIITENHLQSSDLYKSFVDFNNKVVGINKEFEALPVTYKQGALVNKLERQVADKFTKDYASMDGALRAASFVNNTFIGGIERNFVRRPMSTVVGLAALAGMDAAIAQEIELAGESQQGTYGRKASRFMRPTHEKIGDIIIKEQKYEAGFDEKGNLTAIYDINGDAVDLAKAFGKEKYIKDLEDALESQNVYDNAEWEMNGKSIWSTMLDTALDVTATFVGTVGFAKTLQGVAALSKMRGLTNTANVFTKLSKSERLLEFVPMYGQYYGEGVLNGIRSGKMTVQDASLMSILSTAAEAGSEALPFPMVGKLVTGGKRATSKLIAGMTDGNFLAALAKLPTRYARTQALAGFATSLLYETGEEFGMEYGTPILNQLANNLLDAKFTDLDLPTLRDLRDLAIITMGATIIPGAMGSIQTYEYFKSDDFVKHSLFKVIDPKNAELTDAFLAEMAGSNKLTKEEVDKFNTLRNELSRDYASIVEQGANNKEANNLRADIIGLKAFIVMEKPKLGTDIELNKNIESKIKAAEAELSTKIKKLQDTEKPIEEIPVEDVQSAGLPDDATTGTNEAAGEGSLTLPFYVNQTINVDTKESKYEIYDRATDRKAKQYEDVTFRTKEEANAYIQTELNNKTKQDTDNNIKPNNTISFYHGGLSEDFTIEDLDVSRLAEKQQKKGRNYAGFYLYDETQKAGAETYSQQTGKGLHRFDINEDAKILELGNIERVTQEQLNEYRKRGYDLVKGTDVRGRVEYILLNKEVVKNVVSEKIGNTQGEEVTETSETQEKSTIDFTPEERVAFDKADSAGKLETIKTKLKDVGLLTFENENGEPC